MRRGAERLPSSALSRSHQLLVPPVITSPPRPSIVPVPTMPEFAGAATAISALQLVPVSLPPHLLVPGNVSESAGLRDRNRVVPVSSQRLTPVLRTIPAATKAVLSPSVARRTDCPVP